MHYMERIPEDIPDSFEWGVYSRADCEFRHKKEKNKYSKCNQNRKNINQYTLTEIV